MLHFMIRIHSCLLDFKRNTHRLCRGVVSGGGIRLEVLEVGVEAEGNLLFFLGVLGDRISDSSSIHYVDQLRVETAGWNTYVECATLVG